MHTRTKGEPHVCGRMGLVAGLAACLSLGATAHAATNYTVVGWNNLGMHCMDSDYTVFSILPPYNTINAQIIQGQNGTATKLTNGYAVAYQAIADPAGSLNTTSRGKTAFWDHSQELFGANLPVDAGLPVPSLSFAMPGVSNTPQAMVLEPAGNWFVAYGIPLTPYDDAGKPNSYPMMRLTATDGAGHVLTNTDIVLPVSDEMNCRLCHLSGSAPAARPTGGWISDSNPGRDYRLNVLALHDQWQFAGAPAQYAAALATNHLNPAGLYATVTHDKRAILCAACHGSEALPGSGLPALGIKPLTAAIHTHHAPVVDPRTHPPLTLDNETNLTSCYTCHPGSITRCLRGVMGKAINPVNGAMAMQCQSCHGNLSAVGSTNRTGWLNEPNCQACHTGHALANNGQIRYTSVFTTGVVLRLPATNLFATTANAPLPNTSLYRYSEGHGGVKCAGCHGSTHAEFPSAFTNDNVTSVRHQGHTGVLAECDTCHGAMPNTVNGGPHGLHPIGQTWVSGHQSAAGQACRSCHGTNYAGTVLSLMQRDRTINGQAVFQGQQIGCYNCHNGAGGSGSAPAAPTVTGTAVGTAAGISTNFPLTATKGTLRIISQPAYGSVSLSSNVATYFPSLGFTGTDTFTFAANSGFRDSTLATVTVIVTNTFSLGDAVPDWWRRLYFSNVTASAAALTADPDQDGLDNLGEFIAGTDPNDARSNLRIHAINVAGNVVSVGFVSWLGGHYAAERGSDLRAGLWTSLNSNVWGHTDVTAVGDPSATNTPRFYRVRAIPP